MYKVSVLEICYLCALVTAFSSYITMVAFFTFHWMDVPNLFILVLSVHRELYVLQYANSFIFIVLQKLYHVFQAVILLLLLLLPLIGLCCLKIMKKIA